VCEVLMRRKHLAVSGAQRWTASTHAGNGFTAAADDGRHAAGIAVSGEAVQELLAGLATPPGAYPKVDWTTTPPAVPRRRRMDYADLEEPGSIRQLVADSADILDQLAAVLREPRVRRPVDEAQLQEKIVSQAVTLNRAYPLVREASYAPDSSGRLDDEIGTVALNDRVPTDMILGGGGPGSWNDFGSHRPEQVRLIIRKLLTAPDPSRALVEILTDDGHVHLSRYPGPGRVDSRIHRQRRPPHPRAAAARRALRRRRGHGRSAAAAS
jgi:hypothetical protein